MQPLVTGRVLPFIQQVPNLRFSRHKLTEEPEKYLNKQKHPPEIEAQSLSTINVPGEPLTPGYTQYNIEMPVVEIMQDVNTEVYPSSSNRSWFLTDLASEGTDVSFASKYAPRIRSTFVLQKHI